MTMALLIIFISVQFVVVLCARYSFCTLIFSFLDSVELMFLKRGLGLINSIQNTYSMVAKLRIMKKEKNYDDDDDDDGFSANQGTQYRKRPVALVFKTENSIVIIIFVIVTSDEMFSAVSIYTDVLDYEFII